MQHSGHGRGQDGPRTSDYLVLVAIIVPLFVAALALLSSSVADRLAFLVSVIP